MKIAFRVDASLSIGSGHVFRCLNLADSLKNMGGECTFITKQHAGNLINFIETRSFGTFVIPSKDSSSKIYIKDENAWLDGSQQDDVLSTVDLLRVNNFTPDIFILDHYSLDEEWEEKIHKTFPQAKIVVIDDLCNRKHLCSLLVDSTIGRSNEDYKGLVPVDCITLLGTDYALLKEDFVKLRNKAMQRRSSILIPRKILITMGGVDIDNTAGKVLNDLNNNTELDIDLVTVVLGLNCPHKNNIKKLVKTLKYNVDIKINVNNMPQLMLEHDLSIGALGSTTWERAVLGLPTVNIAIADNQLVIVDKLRRKGFIVFEQVNFNSAELKQALERLIRDYKELVSGSFSLCDGQGLSRTLKAIMNL